MRYVHGHAHPAIVKAIQEQSEKLWHISNLFESPGQEKLAESLVKDLHLSHAFFCNSGAEANEAAIKLARKHTGKHQNHRIPTIIPRSYIWCDECDRSRKNS